MISTLLMIGKIIGIVLASIIGIILVLILFILFWPYHYSVMLSKEDSIEARVNISYFFHLISVWLIYDSELNIKFKILGIPFYNHLKNKTKARKTSDKKSAKKNSSDEESNCGTTNDLVKIAVEDNFKDNFKDDFENNFEHNLNDDSSELNSNEYNSNENNSKFIGYNSNEVNANKENPNKKKINKKKSVIDKIYNSIVSFINKITSFGKTLFFKIENFLKNSTDKIEKISDTIVYYDNLFSKKGSSWAIEYIKENLIKILKAFKPYKTKIYLLYASEEPDKVGRVLMAYSLAYPYLAKNSRLEFDYDRNCFNFNVDIKGYFVLGYIAIIGLKMVLNKKLRKFIKLLKMEDNK